jgi:superfamily I DNA/RNA helicase
MALMVDCKPMEYQGEKLVWELLAEKLPDDVIVYNHREIISDREFDFALLIKGMGILILEVKGWQAKYIFDVKSPDEIIIRGEDKPLRSPEKQARGYRFDWLNFLEDKFSISPVILSMVCYPFMSEKDYVNKRLDMVSGRDFTLFAEDLNDSGRLGRKINNIFLKKKFLNSTPLDDYSIALIRQYFEPSFKVKENCTHKISECYSILKVFKRKITKKEIEDLIKTYFSGTKIYLFFVDCEDLKRFTEVLWNEFHVRNIVVEKDNLRLAGRMDIRGIFDISRKSLRVFHMELYIGSSDLLSGDVVTILEGNVGAENEKLLEELSNITEFNYAQFRVEHAPTDSNIMVEAGAGTGKTYSMVSRIAFLCNKRNAAVNNMVDEIVMVTFTNESADNMKLRLKRYYMNCYILTRRQKYLHQIEAVELMQISTIHKFAKSIIKSVSLSFGLGYGFTISASEYAKEQVYEKYLNDYLIKKQEVQPNFAQQLQMPVHRFRKLLMKFTAQLYNKSCGIKELKDSDLGIFDAWPFFNEVIQEVMIPAEEEYRTSVLLQNKLDLKESMILLNEAVSNLLGKKCELHYKYIFIDEFQDTDDVQIDSFLKLQGVINGVKLFVVGDLKQSIYRFRGATVSAFELIQTRNAKWEKPYYLTTNYRTDSRLLNILDKIFTKMGQQKRLPFISGRDTLKSSINAYMLEQDLLKKIEVKNEQMRMDCLFVEIESQKRHIRRIEEEHKLSDKEKTIAILVRENWQIHNILEEAKGRGIYVETEVGGDLYQLAPAIDLYKLILALLNPIEPVYLYNLISSNYIGIPLDIQGLHGVPLDEKVKKLVSVLDEYYTITYGRNWNDIVKETRNLPILMLLRNIYEASRPWEKYDESEIAQKFYKANYELVLEKIIKMYSVDYLTLNVIENSLHINILTKQQETARNVNLHVNDIRVICTTVHKSKGLEYGTVILPFMSADISSMKKAEIDVYIADNKLAYGIKIGSDSNKKYNSNYDTYQEQTEKVNEESRILYVALTRAIRNVVWFKDIRSKNIVSWQTMLEG